MSECLHFNHSHGYDHSKCADCGYILTDGFWGCASRMWFRNVEQARYWQKNGFLPGNDQPKTWSEIKELQDNFGAHFGARAKLEREK